MTDLPLLNIQACVGRGSEPVHHGLYNGDRYTNGCTTSVYLNNRTLVGIHLADSPDIYGCR